MALRLFAVEAARPETKKYMKSHEWADVDGEVGTVGISDFAQAELGQIVFVELPEEGTQVTKGQPFGVVESVKAASDVYSPLSGEVVEINSSLKDAPEKLNDAPFSEGWMIKVKLEKPEELDELLDNSAYTAHCDESKH
eukprot:jgi/Mesen1/4936/ME000246S04158